MDFHIFHHHTICPPSGENDSPALALLAQKILQNQKTIMATLADIQAQNVTLIAAVKAEDTVIGSAVVLINGFSKQLADLQTQLAAAIAANDPAALQAVSDSLGATAADVTAQSTALAAAVAANTPAAPAAPAA